jgi:hypothetical protein
LKTADVTFSQLIIANEVHPASRNSEAAINVDVQIDGPYLTTIKMRKLDGPIFACKVFHGIILGDSLFTNDLEPRYIMIFVSVGEAQDYSNMT